MNSIKWETIISNLSLTNQTTLPPPPPPTTMNDVKFSNQLIKFEAEDEDEDELYRNFFQNSTTVSIRPSWPTASEVGHDSRVTVTDREKSPAQPVYSDTFTCHWIDCNQSFTSRAQLVSLKLEEFHFWEKKRFLFRFFTSSMFTLTNNGTVRRTTPATGCTVPVSTSHSMPVISYSTICEFTRARSPTSVQ